MKKKQLITAGIVVVSLSVCGLALSKMRVKEAPQANKVAYIDKKDHQAKKNREETPDEVSAREGINAEQIVVKITDKGYVTSHGDHYHYYNGKVPYDAIISEELLMKDPNYRLDQSHIVNEVKGGYIIKVDGKYYLYLKENADRSNLRTKEEVARQKDIHGPAENSGKSGHGHSGKAGRGASGGNSSDAGGGLQRNHRNKSGRYTTDDGYVFNPTDVIEDTGDGFIVPHHDHFHFIPKADLSPGELAAAQDYWNRKSGKAGAAAPASPQANAGGGTYSGTATGPRYEAQPAAPSQPTAPSQPAKPTFTLPLTPPSHSSHGTVSQPAPTQPAKPADKADDWKSLLKELYAQPLSKRHVESDGLVFDPATIVRRTASGVSVPHGDHFHYIFFKDMSPLEEKIARMIPIGGQADATDSHHHAADNHANGALQPTLPLHKEPEGKLPERPENKERAKFYDAMVRLHKEVVDKADRKNEQNEILSLMESLHKDQLDYADLWKALLPLESKLLHPERQGKKNSEIAYTKEEVELAKLAGHYTTSDGYVFDPADIVEDLGEGYVTPHFTHSHYIPKEDLPTNEYKRAAAYLKEHPLAQPADNEEVKPTQPSQPSNGSDATATKERAVDIYRRVAPAKIVPAEKMPQNTAYAVEEHEGLIVIPHHDHYHNVKLDYYDSGLYPLPEGYSMEDFLATLKYYIQHPEDRPTSDDGWGNASDHGKHDKEIAQPKHDEEEEDNNYFNSHVGEEEPDTHEDEEDDFDTDLKDKATAYGMSLDVFKGKLLKIALKYGVGLDSFRYNPADKTVSLTTADGQEITVALTD